MLILSYDTMPITYEVAKAKEHTLQALFEDTEFNVTFHPITGACVYYTDGTAASCVGKIHFVKKGETLNTYVVYVPLFYLSGVCPVKFIERVEEWWASMSKKQAV